MSSWSFGKNEVIAWIKQNFPQGSTCLDVGPCDGRWWYFLHDYLTMDAVEIYKPYIDVYELKNKYREVINADVADLLYPNGYDLIIFGDVIEHMPVDKAQKVLDYASKHCNKIIVAVPFLYKQGPMRGNKYEEHIQDDLTPELFNERYPGFTMIYNAFGRYAYYVKDGDKHV